MKLMVGEIAKYIRVGAGATGAATSLSFALLGVGHLVGLSVSLQADLEPMRSVIIALRQSSRNPAVGVMVGGPLLLQTPDLSSRVGADLSAPDAASAVTAAQAYLAARHRQS